MKLFLCEKPSQGRDIARNLDANTRGDGCLRKGNEIVVTWAIGHLVEMANPDQYDASLKKWSLNSLPIHPDNWVNIVKKQTKKQYNIIVKLIKQASHIVVATDADREGEVIARELIDAASYKGEISRLWLSALDDISIQRALGQIRPGSATEALYAAGLARSRCDWLVGMNLTRLYTLKAKNAGYDGVLSVGRVQTPTLRMVVDRDLLIENFVPVDFFDVIASFSAGDSSFLSKWIPGKDLSDDDGRCINKESALNLVQQLQGSSGKVVSFKKERKKQAAPLPFSLDSLTAFCDRAFGLGAKQVLDVAQSLYETHKVTTYPRSDCEYLPKSQIEDIDTILHHLVELPGMGPLVEGCNPSYQSRVWNDKKITAHHAIIPTLVAADLSKMPEIERKVYDAICRRYLAQFYPAYEYDQTTIFLNVNGERFKATGRVDVLAGWKVVIKKGNNEKGKNREDNQSLPVVAEDDLLSVIDANIQAKKTKPPSRYTEGTLGAAMKNVAKEIEDPALKKILRETTGIGTVATRPAIFEVLLKRGLLKKKGKQLISSSAGRSLINALPEAVKSPGTTAMWEQSLEMIAEGKVSMDEFIESQRNWISKIVDYEIKNVGSMSIKAAAKFNCPECNDVLRRIKGKKGFFWGCSNRECKYTAPDNRGKPGKRKTVITSNIDCPDCGKKLRQLSGSKGKFWGCSGYSNGCKFTAQDKAGKPVL